MRGPPPAEFETRALVDFLADAWDLEVEAVRYAPVGGGSYHWIVSDVDGTRRFVTADDLDVKPWLGEGRESVFEGLSRAFETAVALQEAGVGFVAAPTRAKGGQAVARFGPQHSVALFPFVDGRTGTFGRYEPDERAAVLTMLAELHLATPAVASTSPTVDLSLPGRHSLEDALEHVNEPWLDGPLSEAARQALAGNASDVTELLALHDRLAGEVGGRAVDRVLTHGEPHAGNLMSTRAGYVLVDWDTVALAPRERDLWMLVADSDEDAAIYTDATGHQLDEVAVDFFRLTWDLADIASFSEVLRSPHPEHEGTARALENLKSYFPLRDRWPTVIG